MPDTILESAFAELFINDIPLLDVRSPIEFERGSFPHASNLPLLTDAERQLVGSEYKQLGRTAAIELGNDLLSGEPKSARVQQWLAYLQNNPGALLTCFRGGLRSQTVQQWLQENNISVPRVAGGYKAMRRFLIDSIENSAAKDQFIIVAGKTGTGKTHLIQKLTSSVDLEGLANHRGSAFGRRVSGQPSQINFENSLAIALLKLSGRELNRIFLEDESRSIGSLSLPLCLYNKMRESPIAVVETSLESRITTIRDDYIISNYRDFKAREIETAAADDLFSKFLLTGLERIKKRLGAENYSAIRDDMEAALQRQKRGGDTQGHRQWIEKLLLNYYDPMYDYQLGKKSRRIVFRGSADEFLDWAASINAGSPGIKQAKLA